MVAVMRDLFEPYPFFHHPEPWVLFSRGRRDIVHAWDRVCAEALRTGDAERLHTAREDYQAVLTGYLKVLDGYLMLAGRFGGEQELADRLSEARDEIQSHYDSLFPRWQTLDDLEAILLERITPTNAELKELAKKYPPPPSWYEETENPFAPTTFTCRTTPAECQ